MFLSEYALQDATVEWKDDGTGYAKTKWNQSSLVFEPRKAIEYAISSFCVCLVAHLNEDWQNHRPITTIGGGADDCLSRAYPPFSREKRLFIESCLKDTIPKLLEEAIKKTTIDNDFVFLAKLGLSRNWKSGCALCLTNKIMGTTCSCGHTEIAIFRPCGHALCANPCFKFFIKKKGVNLKPKEYKIDGHVLVARANIDVNISTNFECPLCRNVVNSTFKAEEVNMEKFYDEFVTSDLIDQLV